MFMKLMFSTDLSCLYLASCTDRCVLLLCRWLATLMPFNNAAHVESHTLGSACLSEDNRSQWGFENTMNTIGRIGKKVSGFWEQKESVAFYLQLIFVFSYYGLSSFNVTCLFSDHHSHQIWFSALNKASYALTSCLSLPRVTTCHRVHVVMSCFWLIAASCAVVVISPNRMPRCPSAEGELSASLVAFVKTQDRKKKGQGLSGPHAVRSLFPFAFHPSPLNAPLWPRRRRIYLSLVF